jgi:hypothetical protein
MDRHVLPLLGALSVLLAGMATAADRQTVNVVTVKTYAGKYTATSGSAPASGMRVPCGEPVPAETNPPARNGEAVPSCDYSPAEISGSQVQFIRADAILTIESGQKYRIVLYCEGAPSACPKLGDGHRYVGQMDKKAVLDSSSKLGFGPTTVILRPDGKHSVKYRVYYQQKI